MKVYYINSTHWDREWYMPFQGHRYNLVNMVEGLLDIMEQDPQYKLFCFDGQTIVLEDYVQVVPEGAERPKKLIADGRLRVGPWYVMPDEFLVSGESLIRNLMVGHEIARKWGAEAWKYGYVCDIFGHIAQLPQILNGFDIHGAFMSRGLGKANFSHFLWKAPNGSKCYGTIGQYGSFTRRTLGKFHTEEFPEMLKKHITRVAGKSEVPIVVFSNTDDHAMATAHTPELLKLIGELFPEAEVVDADLSCLAEELCQYENILPIVCGELNDPSVVPGGCAELLPHCLSSYYPLKQENDRCQNLLEKQIEPLLAVSALEQQPIRHSFVDLAYRYLLQNHPHDSICGCSADQVHKDMIYRYDQVKTIVQRLKEQFLEFRPDGDGEDYELRLYNFTASPCNRTVYANIDFHKNYPAVKRGMAGEEACNCFRLLDDHGGEIPYQLIGIERNVPKRNLTKLQTQEYFDVYTICFEAQLPAFGYAAYRVSPSKARPALLSAMPCGDDWAENAFIRLEIRSNGQLDILDKRSGKCYRKLHEFADDGEVGDGWMHETPINSHVVSGCGAHTSISRLYSGFAATAFRIEKTLPVPACAEGFSRSAEKKQLSVCYIVKLKKDSAAVEIELTVDNTARDHRLRLMLPGGIKGEQYFAGQAFYCVQRKSGVAPGSHAWPEPECHEKNMNGIFGKRDADGDGLAFLSAEGLHECAAYDDAENTLAVTLFRSFGNVYLNEKSEQAQLTGKLKFRYAIMPLDAKTEYAALLQERRALADADFAYSRRLAMGEELPAAHSYFALDNSKIRVSVFKCAQDGKGYILRLYNASEVASETVLTVNFAASECMLVNLNEETIARLPMQEKLLSLAFKPWEIQTLRLI